jgi:protein TonB
MDLRARHWSFALFGAVLLHGAGLGWLAVNVATPGAFGAGVGGIQVSLGPTGGTPGEAAEATPDETPGIAEALPEAQEVAPAEAASEAAEKPEEVAVAEVQEAVAATLPEKAPESLPLYAPVEPVELREAEPEPSEEVAVAEAVEAPPAMETPAAPPVKPEPPVQEAVMPEEAPELLPQPVETAALQAPEREMAAPAAAATPAEGNAQAALQGSGGKAGVGESTGSGSARAQSAGGNPGDHVDYGARLLDWLRKHKKYPRRAQLRGYEGTAWLTFAIDREGHLLDYTIDEGTGHSLLDQEVVAMIKRASPLPAPPPDDGKSRFVYRVPVNFGLD